MLKRITDYISQTLKNKHSLNMLDLSKTQKQNILPTVYVSKEYFLQRAQIEAKLLSRCVCNNQIIKPRPLDNAVTKSPILKRNTAQFGDGCVGIFDDFFKDLFN